MSFMQELGPFVRLCQFTGLISFRMILDAETGRFQSFAFSWRQPITWFFIILFFSYIGTITLCVSIFFAWITDERSDDESNNGHYVSLVIKCIICFAMLCHFVTVGCCSNSYFKMVQYLENI